MRDPRRLLWVAFVLLSASVLVDLAFYVPDHRSTALLALAALVAVCALGGMAGALVVAFRLTPDGLTRLRDRAARWRDVYITAGLAITVLFGLGMRPEWVYTHIGLTLSAGLALGYDLLYAEAPTLSRRWMAAAAVAAVAVTLVRISGLSLYPVANINDEPWVLGWALSYARQGYFSDPIMYFGGGDIQRFMLPVAWWIRIVGVGYWQVRLFFFLLIFPLIALTALAARNLYGSGWITALVMFSSAVVMGGARIRHDIGLALAIAASLWLYSEAVKRNQRGLHLLAGLAMGLGLFAHYHAALFGVVMALCLYAPDYIDRARQKRWLPQIDACLYGLGGLIGAVTVFLLQILPDWDGFLGVRQPQNPQTLDQFIHTFVGYWNGIAVYSQLELLIVIAALAAALWRHRRTDLKLALLLLLLHLALALQAGEPYPQYVLQISPVYGILIGALFTQGLSGRKIAYAAVATGLVMFANLGLTLQTPLLHLIERQPLELPTPPIAAWIRENVPLTESIVTEHWYYLFLTDYKFISPVSPDNAPLSKRLASATAMWDQIAPDVVVIDRNLSTCCVQQPIYDAAYLQSRGYHLATQLPGDTYPVLVYEKGKTG